MKSSLIVLYMFFQSQHAIKNARIYEPQVSRFFFPANDQIVLYLGEMNARQLHFPSLLAAYEEQNNNGMDAPLIIGSKY